MPVPVALKAFVRIVLPLELEELRKLRITAFDLLPRSVAMIRQIISASSLRRHDNQPAKGVRRALQSFRAMDRMEIEDCARVRLLCPSQEALVIALDEAYSAVDQINFVFPKVSPNLIEEVTQH